jgi:integration host factor subunit alpha
LRKANLDKLSLGSGLNKQKGMGPMAGRTVRREDLSEAVYQKVGLSRSESAGLVGQVLGEISDTLARGEAVKLSGFGTFSMRSKVERVWLNPKTGVEVSIEKRRVLIFKPSEVLKAQINGED